MSTLRADSVAPAAGGTTRNLPRGVAASWINFNGTGTVAARDSQNVSSLVDNATGDYTVNASSVMSSGSYNFDFAAGDSTGALSAPIVQTLTTVPTATALRFLAVRRNDGGANDYDYVCAKRFGSLA